MRAFVVIFVIAAIASALLTPLVRRVALRVGAVSNPGGRNVNERTVPRLGGVAIFTAIVLPLAAAFGTDLGVAAVLRDERLRVTGLLVGAVVMVAVGVLDDTRRVRALHKLFAQLSVAIVAFACGFRIDAVDLPFVGPLSMGIFALPVTALWIVGVINAVNLIDGLDGLAAGIVFFAGVTNFVVAYVSGSTLVGIVQAAMLGAVLGFLFFNFNPARIFMGDSGSYCLGFILGAMSLAGASQKASTAVSILVPVLALGVPIFDTLFTMVRRIVERRPIFSPDRGHVHHRLLDMGITHRRAVLILYGVTIALTVAAVAVSLGRSWEVGIAILGASVVLIGLVRFLGYFEYLFVMRRQRARMRSPDAESLRRAMPSVPALFANPSTDEAIWDALVQLLDRTQLTAIEVVAASSNQVVRRCSIDANTIDRSELVSARFPIGDEAHARAFLRFRWRSPSGDVSPQTEVLLQVLVDVVTDAFARVGSDLAPVRGTAADSQSAAVAEQRISRPAHADT